MKRSALLQAKRKEIAEELRQWAEETHFLKPGEFLCLVLSIGTQKENVVLTAAGDAEELADWNLELLLTPVNQLPFSVRARNAMRRVGAKRVGDLIQFEPDTLLSVKNFSILVLNEIEEILRRRGLRLGMALPASVRSILKEDSEA